MIDEEGGQLGIMTPQAALTMAEEKGLDLVEVAPLSAPPVCRILDYGKYLYSLNKKQHDALVKLVEEMLELQKERAEVGELDDRRHALKRRIEQVDKEIDELVYELYGLTEEEIRIVEGK